MLKVGELSDWPDVTSSAQPPHRKEGPIETLVCCRHQVGPTRKRGAPLVENQWRARPLHVDSWLENISAQLMQFHRRPDFAAEGTAVSIRRYSVCRASLTLHSHSFASGL